MIFEPPRKRGLFASLGQKNLQQGCSGLFSEQNELLCEEKSKIANVNTLCLLNLIKMSAMFKIWRTALKKTCYFCDKKLSFVTPKDNSTNGSQASSGEKSNETDAIDRRQQPIPAWREWAFRCLFFCVLFLGRLLTYVNIPAMGRTNAILR